MFNQNEVFFTFFDLQQEQYEYPEASTTLNVVYAVYI